MSSPLVWLGMAFCAAGCVTPAPYDGLIPIDQAGLSQRLGVLCELGVGDATARAACADGRRSPYTGNISLQASAVGPIADCAQSSSLACSDENALTHSSTVKSGRWCRPRQRSTVASQTERYAGSGHASCSAER